MTTTMFDQAAAAEPAATQPKNHWQVRAVASARWKYLCPVAGNAPETHRAWALFRDGRQISDAGLAALGDRVDAGLLQVLTGANADEWPRPGAEFVIQGSGHDVSVSAVADCDPGDVGKVPRRCPWWLSTSGRDGRPKLITMQAAVDAGAAGLVRAFVAVFAKGLAVPPPTPEPVPEPTAEEIAERQQAERREAAIAAIVDALTSYKGGFPVRAANALYVVFQSVAAAEVEAARAGTRSSRPRLRQRRSNVAADETPAPAEAEAPAGGTPSGETSPPPGPSDAV